MWAALSVCGSGYYFTQTGFLNQGYLVPYERIAAQIAAESPPERTLVIVDSFNGDPKPLLAALDRRYRALVADRPGFARRTLELSPQIVWHLRSSRDVSPHRMHERLERRLTRDYELSLQPLLPVPAWQRRLFEVLTGGPAPEAFFRVARWDKRDRAAAPADE